MFDTCGRVPRGDHSGPELWVWVHTFAPLYNIAITTGVPSTQEVGLLPAFVFVTPSRLSHLPKPTQPTGRGAGIGTQFFPDGRTCFLGHYSSSSAYDSPSWSNPKFLGNSGQRLQRPDQRTKAEGLPRVWLWFGGRWELLLILELRCLRAQWWLTGGHRVGSMEALSQSNFGSTDHMCP